MMTVIHEEQELTNNTLDYSSRENIPMDKSLRST